MTTAAVVAAAPARQLSWEDWVMRIGISILCLFLIIAIAMPLSLLLVQELSSATASS